MLKKSLIEAKYQLNSENIENMKKLCQLQSFGRFSMRLGYPNITYEEVVGTTLKEKIELLKAKRKELHPANVITPEFAEKDFLALMEEFRRVGNRNIYGNSCTIFVPPSGYPFNEEVSNTYYYMYDGALSGSEAFNLLNAMVEASLDYAIGGGTKNMFEWIVEVGTAVALQQYENETGNPEDILEPTLTYLANQNYQSPFMAAYILG